MTKQRLVTAKSYSAATGPKYLFEQSRLPAGNDSVPGRLGLFAWLHIDRMKARCAGEPALSVDLKKTRLP